VPPVLVSLLVNDMLTPSSHVELAVYEDEGRHIGAHGLPADAARQLPRHVSGQL
jgi:hypothetical protein